MPGGNWVTQNKRLPGVYINYVGEGNNPAVTGDRGAVGLPFLYEENHSLGEWFKRSLMAMM